MLISASPWETRSTGQPRNHAPPRPRLRQSRGSLLTLMLVRAQPLVAYSDTIAPIRVSSRPWDAVGHTTHGLPSRDYQTSDPREVDGPIAGATPPKSRGPPASELSADALTRCVEKAKRRRQAQTNRRRRPTSRSVRVPAAAAGGSESNRAAWTTGLLGWIAGYCKAKKMWSPRDESRTLAAAGWRPSEALGLM